MVSKHNDLKRPRLGRPPKELAGDVKARILDAAQRVFMEFTAPFRKAAAGEEEGRQIFVARFFGDTRAGETGKGGSDPPPSPRPKSEKGGWTLPPYPVVAAGLRLLQPD